MRIRQLIDGTSVSTAITGDNQNSHEWMYAQELCVVTTSFAVLVQGVLIALLLPTQEILVNWFVSDTKLTFMIQDLI